MGSQDLLFKEESYRIIGAAMRVHAVLGCGFVEKVYQDALDVEFKRQNIPFEREKHLIVNYEGVELAHDFFADFVCFDKIVVELKAVSDFVPAHEAQLHSYMKAGHYSLGYLINFGETSLKSRRIIRTKN